MTIQRSKFVDILLGITTFLIPFYIFRFNLFGIPTNVFEISVFITLIASLLNCFIAGEKQAQKFQFDYSLILYSIFFILFLVSSIIGAARSGFSLDSLGILKSWVMVPMVLGAVVRCQVIGSSYKNEAIFSNLKPVTYYLKPVLLGLYASMLVVSIWAIFQKFGIISTLFYQSGDSSFAQYLGSNFRAFGPFESPNYLAMFIVPCAILALGTSSKLKACPEYPRGVLSSKLWSGLFYISFLLPLTALLLSKSRAGIIALIGSAIIYGAIITYRKIADKRVSFVLVLLSALVFSILVFLVYRFALRPDSDAVRFEIYRYAWQMVKDNWIFGIGPAKFQSVLSGFPITDSFRQFALPYAYHPHNLYLALWLNFGILGLLSFLGVVVATIVNLFRSRTGLSLLLLAALSAILMQGVFDTTYFKNDLSAIFWLIIALSFALKSQVNETSQREIPLRETMKP